MKLRSKFECGKTTRTVSEIQIEWNSELDMVQKFVWHENPIGQFLTVMCTSQGKQDFHSKTLPDIQEAKRAIFEKSWKSLEPVKDVPTVLITIFLSETCVGFAMNSQN